MNYYAPQQVTQVLNHAGAKLPKDIGELDVAEVGTPLTFEHYFRAEHGGVYGLDNDMKRFDPRTYFLRLRPEVPEVKGLYLAGQDVLSDSIMACTNSGLLCAAKVLGKRDPFSLLKKENEDIREEKPDVGAGDEVFGVWPLLKFM